jgi:hypothetical protein
MKALIFNGVVVDTADQEFEVHESMQWVDATDDVKVGHLLNGTSFLAPAEPQAPTYAQLRAREYPSITDYLDGVVKGNQAQIDAYIAACQAVKAKYPKPN